MISLIRFPLSKQLFSLKLYPIDVRALNSYKGLNCKVAKVSAANRNLSYFVCSLRLCDIRPTGTPAPSLRVLFSAEAARPACR